MAVTQEAPKSKTKKAASKTRVAQSRGVDTTVNRRSPRGVRSTVEAIKVRFPRGKTHSRPDSKQSVHVLLRSKLTGQSQVCIPKAVRETLGVSVGDSVGYKIDAGIVTLVAVDEVAEEHRDPAIESFLMLLVRDIEKGTIVPINNDWLSSLQKLVEDVKFDRDDVLDGRVALG